MIEQMMRYANTKHTKDASNINKSIKSLIFKTVNFFEGYRQYLDRVGMKFRFVKTKRSDLWRVTGFHLAKLRMIYFIMNF